MPGPLGPIDIMAGRPAADDLSRFSIEVRSVQGSVWVDGQLLLDGTVTLARRDGRRFGRIHVW